MIDNNRTRSQYMADIFYSGHIHRRNKDENVIVSMDTRNGSLRRRQQLFLRGGAYKDDLRSRWQVQRGQAARPMGGWWLRFRYSAIRGARDIHTAAIEAGMGGAP